MKPFYQTRLSDGRKIELTEKEYDRHLAAAIKLRFKSCPTKVSQMTPYDLIREHLELGGHLKG